MKMKKISTLLFLSLLAIAPIVAQEDVSLTITLDTQTDPLPTVKLVDETEFYLNINNAIDLAVTNAGLVLPDDAVRVKEITLTGQAKYTYFDLRAIGKNFTSLVRIDLSQIKLYDNKIQSPISWDKDWADGGKLKYVELLTSDNANGVFNGLKSLTTVSFPEAMISIGKAAFANCVKLTDVTLPVGLGSIINDAFRDCNSLTIPAGLPAGMSGTIGNSVFINCPNLELSTLPVNLQIVNSSETFKNCPKVTFSTLNSKIPNDASKFKYGHNVFNGSGVAITEIPGVIYVISEAAFQNCNNLTEITFPESMGGTATAGFQTIKSKIDAKAFALPAGSQVERTYIFKAAVPPIDGVNASAFNRGDAVDTQALVLVRDAEALAAFKAIAPFSSMNVQIERKNPVILTVGAFGTVSTDYNKYGVLSNDSIDVRYDDEITFNFTPNPGYIVDSIILDGVNVTPDPVGVSYTFKSTKRHTLSVNFALGTAIENTDADMNVTAFPNPFSDVVNITGADDVQKQIYDATGRMLLQTQANQIDLSAYSQGIYFIKVNARILKLLKK